MNENGRKRVRNGKGDDPKENHVDVEVSSQLGKRYQKLHKYMTCSLRYGDKK